MSEKPRLSPLTMEVKRRDIVSNIKEPCLIESAFCPFVLLPIWRHIMLLIKQSHIMET